MDPIESQIEEQIKSYDYDTLEYPIDVIIKKYANSLANEDEEDVSTIYVPDYQREYVWKPDRKSKFIESILIGVPIPYFFLADVNGRLEIVDGSQRIRTLHEFASGELILCNLTKLSLMNGKQFNDLSATRKRRFLNKSLKAILLSEKTDTQARFDLFERINTGSDELRPAEVRKGAFNGPFYDFIKECSEDDLFKKLCPIGDKVGIRAEGTERVLRFFAYSDSLERYNGDVKGFLDVYSKKMIASFSAREKVKLKKKFDKMLNFVDEHFENGFKKGETSKSTPRVRFEAISVGVSNALLENPKLNVKNTKWIDSDDFIKVTRTDAANNKSNLLGRINFVKNRLLNG